MNPDQAFARIRTAFAEMQKTYGRPVFDEWAVVVLVRPSGPVLAYDGPRREVFEASLANDLAPLRGELRNSPRDPGSFGFNREGMGTRFDAFIVAAPDIYVLCNHTGRSLREIAEDPLWRAAQGPFADLAEAFRLSPLELG